jgi:hypothetical protein
MAGLQEVPELEVQKYPPSMLRNINSEPPGGAEAGDPEASTINAKKRRRWTLGRWHSW